MQNFTILKEIPFTFNDWKLSDIQDVIMLSKDTFLFFDKKNVGIVQNYQLKHMFRNILPNSENITQVEHLYQDLIAIGSQKRIIIFSIKKNKMVKDINNSDIEIQNFLVLNNKTILIAHKQFIYKVNVFSNNNFDKQDVLARTKLDQPICKIYRVNNDYILIQTYYENVHLYNLTTQSYSKYYYYDLPSRLFTDALIFKNDVLVSYSRGNSCINRMNLKNGANYYIENNQIIHQIKKFDEKDEKYLVASYNNGRVVVYERKSQRETSTYFDETMTNLKNAVYALKDNLLFIINSKCIRLVQIEIVERNICSLF